MTWDGKDRRQFPGHCYDEVLAKLLAMEEKVNEIHKAIYGNGDPSRGFVIRMDRLEQFKSAMMWVVSVIGVTVAGIIVNGLAKAMGGG